MRDRHPDLADLALRERMIAVVAGLGRQIEGDGEAGLSLGQIFPIERIGIARGGMAGISAEDPRPVALAPGTFRWLAHAAPSPVWYGLAICARQHNPLWLASA